jgi:hypothetical protein
MASFAGGDIRAIKFRDDDGRLRPSGTTMDRLWEKGATYGDYYHSRRHREAALNDGIQRLLVGIFPDRSGNSRHNPWLLCYQITGKRW